MTKYVVFKSNTFEVENQVLFAYTLEDACNLQTMKEAEGDDEWEIAEVLPRDNWVFRLYRWLHKRTD
jgi:hypothetical protein